MKASIKKVNGVLGIEVPTADIERILKSLNFQPVINGDELTIRYPHIVKIWNPIPILQRK